MSLFAIFALIAAIANTSLALFVYFKGSKRKVNKVFALMSVVIAIYNLECFGLHIGPNEEFVLNWMKFFRWGALYSPSAIFYFFLTFIEDRRKINRVILGISLIISTILLLNTYLGEINLKKFIGGYFPERDIYYDLFLFNTLFILGYGLYLVYKKYRSTKMGIRKTQMKYFFLAVTIGILIAPVNFFVSYGINIPPFGQIGIVIYTAILAYSIVKYKLIDIETIFHKTVAYIFLSLLVLISYAALLIIIQKTLLHEIIDLSNPVYEGIILLGFLFIFAPLKNKSQEMVNKVFYRKRYDYLKVLEGFTDKLANLTDLDNLLSLIVETITTTLQIEKASIMLLDNDRDEYLIKKSKGIKNVEMRIPRIDEFIIWLEKERKVVEREEILIDPQYNGVKDLVASRFKDLEAEVCIPLIIEQRMIGLLNLGKKISGESYKRRDIELLTTLGRSASISINNAMMYRLAITDGLTKLYNYGYFQEYLENQLKLAKRYNTKLSLIIFDIDHFKKINDNFRHQQGDLILKELAKLMRNNIKAGDLAFRYGGDEFVLLFPNVDGKKAWEIAERIRYRVQNYKFPKISEKDLKITISAGIAEVREDTQSKENLLVEADEALYNAKANGRNCCILYIPQ